MCLNHDDLGARSGHGQQCRPQDHVAIGVCVNQRQGTCSGTCNSCPGHPANSLRREPNKQDPSHRNLRRTGCYGTTVLPPAPRPAGDCLGQSHRREAFFLCQYNIDRASATTLSFCTQEWSPSPQDNVQRRAQCPAQQRNACRRRALPLIRSSQQRRVVRQISDFDILPISVIMHSPRTP